MIPTRYLTLSDFAKYVHKAKSTVYYWKSKGKLPIVELGNGITMVDMRIYALNDTTEGVIHMSEQLKRRGVSTIKRNYTAKNGTKHSYEYYSVRIKKSCPTFYAYAKQYEESRRDIKPVTRKKMLGVLKNHIKPVFEFIPVTEITKDMIKNFLYSATSSQKEIKTIFNTVFDELVDNDIVQRNVARMVKRPVFDLQGNRLSDKKRELPTKKQLDAWYAEVCKSKLPQIYVVKLMCCTGLSRSEVLGLKKTDIHFDNCSVTVNRAWVIDDTGKAHLGELKNKYRSRVAWFPKEIATELQLGMSKTKGIWFAGLSS
jgi:integrase